MTLVVYSWGANPAYGDAVIPFRDDDVRVDCMVRAVKGALPAKSSALIMAVDGNTYRVAAGTESVAFHIFGQWGAQLLAQWWRDAMLVAVPSSSHTVFSRSFTASLLADAISAQLPQELNIKAAPVLAFKVPMSRASAGQSGNSAKIAIQAGLKCHVDYFEMLIGRSVVLIDDVCVSGAHLIACAHFLRGIGAEVGLALCLARSVQSQHPTPLLVDPEDIEAQVLQDRS